MRLVCFFTFPISSAAPLWRPLFSFALSSARALSLDLALAHTRANLTWLAYARVPWHRIGRLAHHHNHHNHQPRHLLQLEQRRIEMFLGRANTDTPLSSVVGRSCAATTVPLADSMLIDDDDDDDDDEDDEEVLSFGAGGLSLRESGYIRSFSPLSSARAGLRSSSVPRPTTTAATTTTTSPSSMTATMTTATTATTTTSNITPPSTPSPPPLPAFEHTPTMSLSQSFTAPSTPLRPEPLQRTGSSTSPQRAALSQSTGGRSFMTQRLSQEFRMLPKPPASRKEAFHVFASAINPENTVKNRYTASASPCVRA